MIENNENALPSGHEKVASCDTCPYKNYYFLRKENDKIYPLCMNEYFTYISMMKDMQNNFTKKQIYLVIPRFEKLENNFCIPQFVINTYDGIEKNYQAEIKRSVYNRLLLVLAKCTLIKALTPIVIAIRGRIITPMLPASDPQFDIIDEVFNIDKDYIYERPYWPELENKESDTQQKFSQN